MKKKKYKVCFSVFNLFEDTQKEVVKLQTMFKSFLGSAVIVTWLSSSATFALVVGIGAMVIDTILACFSFELINENGKVEEFKVTQDEGK